MMTITAVEAFASSGSKKLKNANEWFVQSSILVKILLRQGKVQLLFSIGEVVIIAYLFNVLI